MLQVHPIHLGVNRYLCLLWESFCSLVTSLLGFSSAVYTYVLTPFFSPEIGLCISDWLGCLHKCAQNKRSFSVIAVSPRCFFQNRCSAVWRQTILENQGGHQVLCCQTIHLNHYAVLICVGSRFWQSESTISFNLFVRSVTSLIYVFAISLNN